MRFVDPIIESYRAYKYDWEGQALVPYLIAEVDSINSTAVLTYNVFGNDQFDLYRIWHGISSSGLHCSSPLNARRVYGSFPPAGITSL